MGFFDRLLGKTLTPPLPIQWTRMTTFSPRVPTHPGPPEFVRAVELQRAYWTHNAEEQCTWRHAAVEQLSWRNDCGCIS